MSHRPLSARGAGAVLGTVAVLASATVVAAPARAEGTVSACHWIDREYSATYTCEKPVKAVTDLAIVECWRYPAPARSYVRQKTADGWIRNPLITVRVTGAKGCSDPYPYRTVVTIPASLLTEMTPVRVRLTMPATTGALPDGTEYSFGKTVVTYGACTMPEDAADWCPER